jgi:hypothetical protein
MWYTSVPSQIRKKAAERLEDDQGKGAKETYLDLIDFRTIAVSNWNLFEEMLAFGKTRNKEKRTQWIVRLNDMRKVVMHPAKQQVLTWDDLTELDGYASWIRARREWSDNTVEETNG